MACHLSENRPLLRLCADLGAPVTCHSWRTDCHLRRPKGEGRSALGAVGAAIGYCQALFSYAGEPRAHTEKVRTALQLLNAPWFLSHEIYWGYRRSESATGFLERALLPLVDSGRVPVLITGLEVTSDADLVASIFEATPPLRYGETLLVRVLLGNAESIPTAVALVTKLVNRCAKEGHPPLIWPLFQAAFKTEDWKRMRESSGSLWQYVNLAVNPFTVEGCLDAAADQVTVAQIPIGQAAGIGMDGRIDLPPAIAITGASAVRMWHLGSYVESLGCLPGVPTLILLGPSKPDASDDENASRIACFLPLLRGMCEDLWKGLSRARRERVWAMAA